MALVNEIVTRFRAETDAYTKKLEEAKNKNKEVAKSLLEVAGSSDKAIASLTVARKSGNLGEFGIDQKQVSGVIAQIKALDKEARGAGKGGLGALKEGWEGFAKVAGAAVIADQLEKITSKAKDVVQQYREGKVEAGAVAETLLGQIPIYGKIWQAGRNIREIMGLQNNELEKQIQLQERVIVAMQKQAEIRKTAEDQQRDRARKINDVVAENNAAAMEAGGNKEGADKYRANYEAKNDIADFKREAEESAKALADTLQEQKTGAKDGLKTLVQERDAAYAQLANAKEILARPETDNVEMEAVKRKAEKDLADAQTTIGQTESRIRSINSDIEKINAEAARAIAAFEKARNEKLEVDSGKITKDAKDAATKVKEDAQKEAQKLIEDAKKKAAEEREKAQKEAEQRKKEADAKAKKDKELTKDAVDLLTERKDLDMSPRSVYDTPRVSELRAGQTILSSPTAVSQQQLDEMKKINEKLAEIRDKAKEEGIVIEELSV